jgi:dsRNA-specific ribonuclease
MIDDIDVEYLKHRLNLPLLQRHGLIKLAVCHGSYINECYSQDPLRRETLQREIKRLAHIGDSIMNAAITDYFFHCLLEAGQGELTSRARPLKERRRGAVPFAKEVGLSDRTVCRLGKGISDKDLEGDMLGEMFEALMGAIYLESDRNFTVARDWFHQECGGLLNF